MSKDVSILHNDSRYWTGILDEHFFGFQLTNNASLQFTFRGPDLRSDQLNLTVYFTPDEINSTDLRPMVLSGALQIATKSVSIPGGNGFSGGGFSGQISAHPGGYIFDFRTVRDIGAVYFVVRDASALQRGIKVTVGSPTDVEMNLYSYVCGSSSGPHEYGISEQKFPITVTSDETTGVYLSSPDVPNGVWAEFSPSYLQNVGPRGANATLLLAGDVSTNAGYQFNSSLFIDASGSTNGLMGEGLIALNSEDGGMHILRSPGPVGFASDTLGVIFSQGVTPSTETNQTNYAVGGGLYDPTPGSFSNATLSVKITGVALVENGTEVRLPSWLQVTPVNSSFVIQADQPYYFQICVSINTSTPQGTFNVALNESVNGQTFMDEFQIWINNVNH